MIASRPSWVVDELVDLYDMAWDFFSTEVPARYPDWAREHRVDRDFWKLAGSLGLLCASMPEQYGGGGGTFFHHATIASAYARTGDRSWSNSIHSGVVAHYLSAFGTDAQKQRWLPQMATGEVVTTLAMTEPSAGSDLKAIRTTAVRDGNEWVITGSKTFISNGSQADLVILAVKTDASAGASGMSLILVDVRDLKGFSRGRVLEKVGQQGADTSELFFDGARVPVDCLLGAEGRGFAMMMAQLPQERLIIGISAVGAIEMAVDVTIEHVQQRQAFGSALFALQNTRFEMAECATLARVARIFLDDCIVRHSQGGIDDATAAMCKWWLTQVQCEVIDTCLQHFGGYGYMLEYPIARLYADARAQKIYGGANEVQKELIARSLDTDAGARR
jgi:acyl-CoA dehydrogenase